MEREVKDAFYQQFSRITKALSSPKRLEMLDMLGQGERPVEALARDAGLSVANASQHLKVLYIARLVDVRRQGVYVHYRLADPMVWRFWSTLRNLGQARLAEVEQLVRAVFAGEQAIEPVDGPTLRRLVRRGEVTLLDVRPRSEYEAGHIPNALSIPLAELEQRLAEIPHQQEVVAYCRGPYCLLAVQAVEMLRQQGYAARRLRDGFPEWRAEGLPVETGVKQG